MAEGKRPPLLARPSTVAYVMAAGVLAGAIGSLFDPAFGLFGSFFGALGWWELADRHRKRGE